MAILQSRLRKQLGYSGHPFADGDFLRALPFANVAIDAAAGTLIFVKEHLVLEPRGVHVIEEMRVVVNLEVVRDALRSGMACNSRISCREFQFEPCKVPSPLR